MTAIACALRSVAGFGLLLAACQPGHDTTQPPATRVAVLRRFDGEAQSGVVAATLSRPLAVKATDASGQPVSGVPVAWRVTAGDGAVAPASSATDTAGIATTRWTMGRTAGAHQATASSAGLATIAFHATATAGPVTSVAIAKPAGAITAGDFLQLSATTQDAYGNPVATVLQPTWATSSAAVATVTAGGLLLALSGGSATVTATIGGRAATLTVTVAARTVPPGTLVLSLGPAETVFRWTTDKCEQMDLPDVPAHPVRTADGSIYLISGNALANYAMRGADFGSLRRVCSPVLIARDLPGATSYENQEWLDAVYRDGNVWHALIHNEYHDPVATNCRVGDTSPANPCWYNSITYAVSHDGGASFTKPNVPAHVVAPAPLPWDPAYTNAATQPQGYFSPFNIVRGQDGFFYDLFFTIPDPATPQVRGLCLMRTQTLGDPASWRAWDGSGFNLRLESPFANGGAPTPACRIVTQATAPGGGSVTFNAYVGKYILVGQSAIAQGQCGFVYSLSTDLIHWDAFKLFKAGYQSGICPAPRGTVGGLEVYASLIDHSDTTVNFERSGQTPYVYYTRFNDNGLDRDLLRQPVIIVKP